MVDRNYSKTDHKRAAVQVSEWVNLDFALHQIEIQFLPLQNLKSSRNSTWVRWTEPDRYRNQIWHRSQERSSGINCRTRGRTFQGQVGNILWRRSYALQLQPVNVSVQKDYFKLINCNRNHCDYCLVRRLFGSCWKTSDVIRGSGLPNRVLLCFSVRSDPTYNVRLRRSFLQQWTEFACQPKRCQFKFPEIQAEKRPHVFELQPFFLDSLHASFGYWTDQPPSLETFRKGNTAREKSFWH